MITAQGLAGRATIAAKGEQTVPAGVCIVATAQPHLDAAARIAVINPGIFVNRKVSVQGEQRFVDARPLRQPFPDERDARPRQFPNRGGNATRPYTPGPPTPSAPGEVTFVQSTPAAIWVILHNLGHYPSVTTIDSSGELMLGAVAYPELETVTISFSQPVAGLAYLV